jgi:hypothetical protein
VERSRLFETRLGVADVERALLPAEATVGAMLASFVPA